VVFLGNHLLVAEWMGSQDRLHCIWIWLYLNQFWNQNYKLLRNVRNVIIEGAPHENKMVGKGQITSERASS
jgi:hypothetical protein